ncbi:hypothetical protein SA3033_05815 [Aggregatibacter actinomycetemcomitans serotype d str. SA3033]|nr:hypothetical protein CF65_02169 [Aggregatibacter actinomycetemcomitans HK1651]KYK74553.1 hypothetical protein SA2876_08450 [Aggregatibacter actinomycetemcomitans serotype e str. SA2876]KYK83793.1 hypothetical protein SA3033_05815 [Aggregatibacter actinomycetemcomitans serotype d str. SA3033]KYK88028.1 hypothetical protein SC29R_04400 [Aggregatibacter actinomycetemcomitans serotype f str. SC29R]KYK90098.1 hypothetical protein SA2200_01130 [Aggregatibacter actinomycetemcomitans serotype d str.
MLGYNGDKNRKIKCTDEFSTEEWQFNGKTYKKVQSVLRTFFEKKNGVGR